MPLPFNADTLAHAPELPGVYTLFRDGEIIYFGRADRNLRARLESHLRGDEGPCTQQATHYETETTFSYILREEQLIAAYRARHGKAPPCNELEAA
jgi:excinuclease UvrABC nuclease subunit